MFLDPRTWSTILYFLAMLPLGILYFTLAVTLATLSLACIAAPLLVWTGVADTSISIDGWQLLHLGDNVVGTSLHGWELPLVFLAGVALLFATLHLARGIGHLHGLFAKHLLVKWAQYA
jgi:hypothetical protein